MYNIIISSNVHAATRHLWSAFLIVCVCVCLCDGFSTREIGGARVLNRWNTIIFRNPNTYIYLYWYSTLSCPVISWKILKYSNRSENYTVITITNYNHDEVFEVVTTAKICTRVYNIIIFRVDNNFTKIEKVKCMNMNDMIWQSQYVYILSSTRPCRRTSWRRIQISLREMVLGRVYVCIGVVRSKVLFDHGNTCVCESLVQC